MMQVTAFRWVPPFAQGVVRDLRVRWALEEAGLPYEQHLIDFANQRSAEYRRRQPFGQVPVFEEDGRVLFESGAIVHHVAERSEALLPRDPEGRARTLTWMFAALNSVEPAVSALVEIEVFNADQEWAKLRRPAVLERARSRLGALSAWLGDRDHLEDRFTAGDLLMTTVLRFLRHGDLLAETPNLAAYRARCEARPAFGRALDAQMAVFAQNAPPASATPSAAAARAR
jgi:glutathione S-transferase